MVLDSLFGIPSQILALNSGGREMEEAAVDQLGRHFQTEGSPCMIGGASGYALTLLGVEYDDVEYDDLDHPIGSRPPLFLLLDPHYTGPDQESAIIPPLHATREAAEAAEGDPWTRQGRRWISWQSSSEAFAPGSFINVCMPILTETTGVTGATAPVEEKEGEADWASMMTAS